MSQQREEIRETSTAHIRKFGVQDFLRLTLPNWYWYLASLAIFIAGATLYIKSTPKQYMRKATVLVKDSRKGSASEMIAFSDIMGGIGRRSVDNEVYIFQSRRLMENVVKRFDLTTRYCIDGKLLTTDLYGH